MKAGDLFAECNKIAQEGGTHISLIKPKKMLKGFPRGELLCETHKGAVYSYPVGKVLHFLISNNLVLAEAP